MRGNPVPVAITRANQWDVRIRWSDGDATGVYPYDYLRGLCPCPECTAGS